MCASAAITEKSGPHEDNEVWDLRTSVSCLFHSCHWEVPWLPFLLSVQLVDTVHTTVSADVGRIA